MLLACGEAEFGKLGILMGIEGGHAIEDSLGEDNQPEGAVMVVGAGSSGSQIADELLRAGRRVFLSVGPHNRPPIRTHSNASS